MPNDTDFTTSNSPSISPMPSRNFSSIFVLFRQTTMVLFSRVPPRNHSCKTRSMVLVYTREYGALGKRTAQLASFAFFETHKSVVATTLTNMDDSRLCTIVSNASGIDVEFATFAETVGVHRLLEYKSIVLEKIF